MNKVVQIYRNFYEKLENVYARESQINEARRFIRNNTVPKLKSSEKKEVLRLWKGFDIPINYNWHRWYAYIGGAFDSRYVPSDIYASAVLPRLQNLSMAKAWADKGYYNHRFQREYFPKTYGIRIDGIFLNDEYCYCRVEELSEKLQVIEKFLIKPSINTARGNGVRIIESKVYSRKELETFLINYGQNYVIQEVIRQHEIMSKLNTSSCNIIRIYTLRLGSQIEILRAILRFGIEGAITDISFVEGKEMVNVVGVTEDGKLMPYVYDFSGNKKPLYLFGVEEYTVLPGFRDVCEMVKRIHYNLHHFDLVGFDVAINESGIPVIIEINLGFPGITLAQYACGPFFGDLTNDVVKMLITREKK